MLLLDQVNAGMKQNSHQSNRSFADRIKTFFYSRTSSETDISHYLQSVDGVPQSLLSMQQLIQWIADVTLYLLASVPYHVRDCGAFKCLADNVRLRFHDEPDRKIWVQLAPWSVGTL